MTRRAAPTQAQIARTIKAAQATGLAVSGVKVDGMQIVVLTSPVGADHPQPQKSAYQEWREKQRAAKERKHGQKATA